MNEINKIKLTRKQKAFANHLLNNPTASATKAAQATYNTGSYHNARVMASQNLAKPAIQLYLDEHVDKAKHRIVTLIDADKEEVQLRASESILNRALGMPTQRTETHSEVVNLNLTLSDLAK